MHKAQSEYWNSLDKPESLGFASKLFPFHMLTDKAHPPKAEQS